MEAQGEGYYVSQVRTGGIIDSTVYPWIVLCSYKKLTEASLVKVFKNVYYKEKPFFILLSITALVISASVFVVLPKTVLIWMNLALQSLLTNFIPMLMFFGVYLWIGLILKHVGIFFSTKACVTSCIILELFIEGVSKIFGIDVQAESPFSLIILTLLFGLGLTATGTFFENMNDIGTLALMNSFVFVRVFILPLTTSLDGWFSGLKLLLVYTYIFIGLVLSTWPSLKILKLKTPSPTSTPTPSEYHDSNTTTAATNTLDDMNNTATIPVIRQRRVSNIDIKSITHNGGIQNQNKTRRKSLPALGAPSARKISMSSMDLTILGEAHGMITDLLADTTLPLNVTGTLRIVADMISPLLQHSLHRQNGPLLTVMEKSKTNKDQEKVMNQPDLKDDTPLSLKQRLQRNLGVSNRRMSSSYTTTTSATGMPTIGIEYHTTKKSNTSKASGNSSPVAIKKASNRSKSYAGVLTPAERTTMLKSHSRSFSQSSPTTNAQQHNISGGLFPIKKELAISDETIFKVEIERGKPVFFEGMDASESENETNESTDDETTSVTTATTAKDIVPLNNGCNNNNNNNNNNRTKFVLDERLEDVKETPEKEAPPSKQTDSQSVSTTVTVTTSSNNIEDNFDLHNKGNSNTTTVHDATACKLEDTNSSTNATSTTTSIVVPTNATTSDGVDKAGVVINSSKGTTPPRRSLRKMSDTSRTLRRGSSTDDATFDSGDNLVIPANNQSRRKSSRELHMEYEVAISRDIDDMLGKVKEWDFPIFELSEKCNVLTQLAFRIFQLCDFFKTFKIPEVTFLKFFRALESGYHNIPYHNRIHAADVLHGVYYLTQHRIPGFNGTLTSSRRASLANDKALTTPTSSEDCPTDDQDDGDNENEADLNLKSVAASESYGCISDSMPDLELMALYVAAAMHDFDHPGRTNAFLVATLNSKALLYNDRSVLESHHAAASWSLLVTNPGLNFLSTLNAADFKRFRFIVIEEILSTDLKKHFNFLTEWNAKISGQGGGLDFKSEADRLLLGQMAIKIADISGPSKEWDLHYRWTERIIEEFYQQGEDERTLGMPTSAYMDRETPQVPQLQASFIKHLVQPLYIAYEKAGILPGEWVEGQNEDEDEEEDEEEEGSEDTKESIENSDDIDNEATDNEDETDAAIAAPSANSKELTNGSANSCGVGTKKVRYCIMSDNIKRNYEKWLRIIEEEKEEHDDDDTSNDT